MQQVTAALSTFKPQVELSPIQQDVIGSLFERLNAQLGAKMADLYAGVGPEDVQSEWAAGLSGFRRSEIERGLAACRTRVFAPNLGEFLRLCRPALDPELAWFEAELGLRARDRGEMGDWSHPAVFRAACCMGMEVRTGPYATYRKRWDWTLSRELAAGWVAEVPAPLDRIENQTRRGPPSAEIRAKIAATLAAAKGKT